MAFEANLSDFTIYAYTVDLNQKVQPLNINFLDFFAIFQLSSSKAMRKHPWRGQKLKIWKNEWDTHQVVIVMSNFLYWLH